MNTIGSRVKALRLRRGLKQDFVAKEIGITQGSLSLIESDNTEVPKGTTLEGLCRVLRTTPDFLIAGAGDPDSIEAAMQEHELVYTWRGLPAQARELLLAQARTIEQSFKPATSDK
jgi:transcriptional regulator with XRE-family HTH domain